VGSRRDLARPHATCPLNHNGRRVWVGAWGWIIFAVTTIIIITIIIIICIISEQRHPDVTI
jgi:hypothetical protein